MENSEGIEGVMGNLKPEKKGDLDPINHIEAEVVVVTVASGERYVRLCFNRTRRRRTQQWF